MKKKFYVVPVLKVVCCQETDVIRTSVPRDGSEEDYFIRDEINGSIGGGDDENK